MILYFFLAALARSISFTLEGAEPRCFNQLVDEGKDLSGAYVISGINDLEVVTTVVDSHGQAVYTSQPGTREGKFDSKADARGFYRLCFQTNDGSSKSISFEFYIQEGLQEENVATQEELNPLRSSLRKLSRNLDTVYRNIQFYERRERTHRDLAEITCDRVMLSAIIKMIVLVAISLAQIYMLRIFFNNKRGNMV